MIVGLLITTFPPDSLQSMRRVWVPFATPLSSPIIAKDSCAIGSYLGKGEVFDVAVAEFALAYAEQAECDHAVLVEAVRSGHMEADDPT